MNSLIIGTRASKLALWQAEHVKALIESQSSFEVSLKKISTKGDRIQDRSLMDIGGKGLFLKEIEDELLAGTVDIAVHSMKDVPYQMPQGLVLGALLEREDATDAFVSVKYKNMSELPEGAVIGTSSLRRLVQLKNLYPKIVFKNLRGNVDTRLQKLDDGEFDGIILASAGLKRLGWGDRITERLGIVSSVGQGAIGIEYKEGRSDLESIMTQLNHKPTLQAVTLERYFSQKLEGSCQTPMGCHVMQNTDTTGDFDVRCFYANDEGTKSWADKVSGAWAEGELVIDKVLSESPISEF